MKTEYKLILKKNLDVILEDTIEIEDVSIMSTTNAKEYVISIMSNGSFSSDAYYPDFIIQGCIQRACERRGWEIDQNYRTRGRDGDLPKNMRYYAVVTSWDNDVHTYHGMGNSATEALLAAYVAAVKAEGKRC